MSIKKNILLKIVTISLLISLYLNVLNIQYNSILFDQQKNHKQTFDTISLNLESHIDETIIFIYGLRGFVYSQINDSITSEEFESYAFESQSFSKYIKNFSIAPGNIQKFVYPILGNEVTLDHDLSTDIRSNVREAVKKAQFTKKIVLSGPYQLRQGGLGMIVRNPIYNNDKYWGLINIAVDVESIINDTLNRSEYYRMIHSISNSNLDFWTNSTVATSNVSYRIKVLDDDWIISGYISEYLEASNFNNFLIRGVLYFIILVLLSILSIILINKIFNLTIKVEDLTFYDKLTNLQNKLALERRLDWLIEHQTPFSISFIDLNNFKDINDSLGHSTGDFVLIEISKRIISKDYDLFRWGGDEFVILKLNTDKNEMLSIIKSTFNTISYPLILNDEPYSTSCSAGIVNFPEDGQSREEILKYVDASMHKAKEEGKNNIVLYSDIIGESLRQEFEIERMLSNAIKSKDFILYYQPQINLESNKMIGAEVLIRWKTDENTFIPPDFFIPIAEKNHMIEEIEEIVLNDSIKQFSQWIDSGLNIKLSINISANHFNQQLVSLLTKLISENSIPSGMLELEITETAFIKDLVNSKELIKQLQGYGITIALDDFGKGYSSLTYLSELRIDTLKIDKAFISKLHNKNSEYVIVKSIMDITKALGITTVAEGVETYEQLDILKSMGCDIIQGYYIKKPCPADDLEKWMKNYL